jgi:hypothetical protein
MTTDGTGQRRARLAPGRRFEEIVERLNSAGAFARKGLQSQDRQVVAECCVQMDSEYQTALDHSLKMHMTLQQCSTFDEKSHELECLRQDLRRWLLSKQG